MATNYNLIDCRVISNLNNQFRLTIATLDFEYEIERLGGYLCIQFAIWQSHTHIWLWAGSFFGRIKPDHKHVTHSESKSAHHLSVFKIV